MRGAVAGRILVALGLVAWLATGCESDGEDVGAGTTFLVQQGRLTISVTESGTITARDQTVIQSQVEGQTTIIYLVDEGTIVEPGDLLVELDASRLQDELVDQQIRVQNSDAAFVRARENLAVAENQAKSDLARAELDLQFAREDLTQYQEGEYPRALKEAEAKITLAKEQLEQAEDTLLWSEKLLEEKYISQAEYEKDRLARERTKLDHELAVADRELLEQYTRKRKVTELESAIEQAELALERATRKARADVVQAEADLTAKESELQRQRDKLAKIEDQIAKCRIVAPVEGMVVYATSSRGGWRGNAEPLDEGQTVRERQELINLPTTSSMSVEVKVHESNLKKVQDGQPVRITVEALPGRTFAGRVTRIAPLPDAQSVWLNPDLKVYTTYIELVGDPVGLRSGMTCRAEIMVARYDDAIYVPVQAVVRVGGTPTAYVVNGGAPEPRSVEIGFDNNRMVRIVSGLQPGEEVLLAPPLADGTAPEPAADEDLPEEAPAPEPAAQMEPEADEPARPEPTADEDERPRGDRRSRWQNMTDEEREAMRRRFEQMTPEEREALRRQRGQRGGRDRRGESRDRDGGGTDGQR
jgi:HlyD family secretion protein